MNTHDRVINELAVSGDFSHWTESRDEHVVRLAVRTNAMRGLQRTSLFLMGRSVLIFYPMQLFWPKSFWCILDFYRVTLIFFLGFHPPPGYELSPLS